MRNAYFLLGVLWLIVIASAWWGIHSSTMSSRYTPPMATSTLSLTSSEFKEGESIPSRYTCDDKRDLNPPLSISGVPGGAKSLTLIMDDPDVPKALKPDGMFDHWVLFNIPPATSGIPADSSAGTPGSNSAGAHAYTGPCPPPEYQPNEHRYVFKLYALDAMLDLPAGAAKAQVEQAMKGHILEETQLVGRYKRK